MLEFLYRQGNYDFTVIVLTRIFVSVYRTLAHFLLGLSSYNRLPVVFLINSIRNFLDARDVGHVTNVRIRIISATSTQLLRRAHRSNFFPLLKSFLEPTFLSTYK